MRSPDGCRDSYLELGLAAGGAEQKQGAWELRGWLFLREGAGPGMARRPLVTGAWPGHTRSCEGREGRKPELCDPIPTEQTPSPMSALTQPGARVLFRFPDSKMEAPTSTPGIVVTHTLGTADPACYTWRVVTWARGVRAVPALPTHRHAPGAPLPNSRLV